MPRGPAIMGILNVTPDSFFDGGKYGRPASALVQAEKMIQEGAHMIDIGGESTRPGSRPVSAEEELSRVLPIVRALAKRFPQIPLSIDTQKSEVARRCIESGARILNDVSALESDPGMEPVVRRYRPSLLLMHKKGNPATMQRAPRYRNVVREVAGYLKRRARLAVSWGVPAARVWIDPGIGFGKTLRHNLQLLSSLRELVRLGHPVCVGVSRKSFIGKILGSESTPLPADERLEGSLAFAVTSFLQGASIFRVHDVGATRRALAAAAALGAPAWK